jgi:H+-transporting ATPase
MGDLVPADIRITSGQVSLDESTLTGETLPVDRESNGMAYAGSMVTRGEASGEVTATGALTRFGKTAELVRTASTVSHLQSVILTIVRYMVALDGILVAALLAYAMLARMPFADTLPFALILLVASVPVALRRRLH